MWWPKYDEKKTTNLIIYLKTGIILNDRNDAVLHNQRKRKIFMTKEKRLKIIRQKYFTKK